VKSASPKRVLIVEDDADALSLLRSWALTQGCDVRAADSAEAALAASDTFKPDMVVSDYSLRGELSGVDLIVQLRERGVKARCVLVTGFLHKALLESVTRIHGVPLLAKPFDLSRLTRILAKARPGGNRPSAGGESDRSRSGS
jgi:DNA-binding NtrC family response regulator